MIPPEMAAMGATFCWTRSACDRREFKDVFAIVVSYVNVSLRIDDEAYGQIESGVVHAGAYARTGAAWVWHGGSGALIVELTLDGRLGRDVTGAVRSIKSDAVVRQPLVGDVRMLGRIQRDALRVGQLRLIAGTGMKIGAAGKRHVGSGTAFVDAVAFEVQDGRGIAVRVPAAYSVTAPPAFET